MKRTGEIPKWMTKAEPFIYVRISSKDQIPAEADKPLPQQTPLKDQLKGIQVGLKGLGLKQGKKANIFYDLASGNEMDRDGFNALKAAVLDYTKDGKRAFFAVSEPSRWSRNITLGQEAFAPFYRREIPILSTGDGMTSHTAKEPRTTEQLIQSVKSIISQQERGTLIERVNRKISRLTEQGILPAAIGTFYPFATADPLDVLKANVGLLNVPKSQGGGSSALGQLVASATAPYGPQATWYKKALEREDERLAKLSPEEYERYNAFRKKWRDLQRERDYDPQSKAPIVSLNRKDVDFGMKAAQRFANGYLRYPFDPKYRMPSDDEINEYLTNPKEYLSDKDKKLYRRLVGKR